MWVRRLLCSLARGDDQWGDGASADLPEATLDPKAVDTAGQEGEEEGEAEEMLLHGEGGVGLNAWRRSIL